MDFRKQRAMLADVWRDKAPKGRHTRLLIRGNIVCLIAVLLIPLSYVFPHTRFWGDMQLCVMALDFVVWTGSEIRDSIKTSKNKGALVTEKPTIGNPWGNFFVETASATTPLEFEIRGPEDHD